MKEIALSLTLKNISIAFKATQNVLSFFGEPIFFRLNLLFEESMYMTATRCIQLAAWAHRLQINAGTAGRIITGCLLKEQY